MTWQMSIGTKSFPACGRIRGWRRSFPEQPQIATFLRCGFGLPRLGSPFLTHYGACNQVTPHSDLHHITFATSGRK